MEQKSPSLKDALVTYVESITHLQQKIRNVRESQRLVLEDLARIRDRCRDLRLQLSRNQA